MIEVILLLAVAILIAVGGSHILSGMIKLSVFKDSINAAFDRDPHPFKPNQRWLLKTLLVLFWHKVDWWNEVFYYKNGKPEWMRNPPPPPLSSTVRSNIVPFCIVPNCGICSRGNNHSTFNRFG